MTPEILFSKERIAQRIDELANIISADYKGKEVVVVATLRGSFVFFADLIRKLDLTVTCEFLALSHYGKASPSSGEVKMNLDYSETMEGKHVLIIEDLVDTGFTTNFINKFTKARNPASLKTCCLILKEGTLEQPVDLDYVGFKIDEEFIVGYGIDRCV